MRTLPISSLPHGLIGLPVALPLLLVDSLSARLLRLTLALALEIQGLLPLVGSLLLLTGPLQRLQIPVQLLQAVVVVALAVLAAFPASAFQGLLRVSLPGRRRPALRRVACRQVTPRLRRARRLALPRSPGFGLPPCLLCAAVGFQSFQRPLVAGGSRAAALQGVQGLLVVGRAGLDVLDRRGRRLRRNGPREPDIRALGGPGILAAGGGLGIPCAPAESGGVRVRRIVLSPRAPPVLR